MANGVDLDQTAPIGAVCSGSTLFASILNSSVMLGNYLQQTKFSDAFFLLGALKVKSTLERSFRFGCIYYNAKSNWNLNITYIVSSIVTPFYQKLKHLFMKMKVELHQ